MNTDPGCARTMTIGHNSLQTLPRFQVVVRPPRCVWSKQQFSPQIPTCLNQHGPCGVRPLNTDMVIVMAQNSGILSALSGNRSHGHKQPTTTASEPQAQTQPLAADQVQTLPQTLMASKPSTSAHLSLLLTLQSCLSPQHTNHSASFTFLFSHYTLTQHNGAQPPGATVVSQLVTDFCLPRTSDLGGELWLS